VLEGDAAAGEALIVIADEQGKTVQYRTVARQFEDTVNWFVAYGSTEVWSIINLTEDTHPFHVHLVQFQALSRDLYNKTASIQRREERPTCLLSRTWVARCERDRQERHRARQPR